MSVTLTLACSGGVQLRAEPGGRPAEDLAGRARGATSGGGGGRGRHRGNDFGADRGGAVRRETKEMAWQPKRWHVGGIRWRLDHLFGPVTCARRDRRDGRRAEWTGRSSSRRRSSSTYTSCPPLLYVLSALCSAPSSTHGYTQSGLAALEFQPALMGSRSCIGARITEDLHTCVCVCVCV